MIEAKKRCEHLNLKFKHIGYPWPAFEGTFSLSGGRRITTLFAEACCCADCGVQVSGFRHGQDDEHEDEEIVLKDRTRRRLNIVRKEREHRYNMLIAHRKYMAKT